MLLNLTHAGYIVGEWLGRMASCTIENAATNYVYQAT
jgi:hypothetical protein